MSDGKDIPAFRDLPEFDEDDYSALLKAIAPYTKDKILNGDGSPINSRSGVNDSIMIPKAPPPAFSPNGIAEVVSALYSLDPCLDNPTWFKIAGALKSLTAHGWPDKVVYDCLWDRWSATAGDAVNADGEPVYDPASVQTTWDTVGKTQNPHTPLTLFKAARDAGWEGMFPGAPVPEQAREIIGEFFPSEAPSALPEAREQAQEPAAKKNADASPEIVHLAALLDAGKMEDFGRLVGHY
jgi:hypothetical protein